MTGRILPVRLLAWAGIGLCLAGSHALLAQQGGPPAAPLPAPINQSEDPILKRFVWRSIGPANMGGRVDDIAVIDRIERKRFGHPPVLVIVHESKQFV